jgi:predicted SpoU family rRNA methylase
MKEEVLKNWTQSRRHINRQAALLARRYCARTDAIKDQSEAFQTILENVEGDYNKRFTNQGKSLGSKELFEFIRKGTKAHLVSHGRRGAERKTDAEVNEYLNTMFTDGVAGGRAD